MPDAAVPVLQAVQAVTALFACLLGAAGMMVLGQVLLALLPAPGFGPLPARRPRVAVLVPAHNESAGLLPTLAQARQQLLPGDRLLVVADNCSDDTAEVARGAGAEVTERFNDLQHGKGYALDYGVRALSADPPEVVVVLDADCSLEPDCIARIASLSHRTGRPVQARYLMKAPDDRLKARVAEFAMRVKNWVRPRGMHRIGLPCGLYGTGMAFPWPVAETAPFASGHLAEDMQLGVRLADLGYPPLFCEEAFVGSVFAGSREGEKSQRTRWEHGHLSLLLSEGPRLLWSALRKGRLAQFLQVADMLIPPLALLVTALGAVTAAGALLGLAGAGSASFYAGAAGLSAVALAIVLARHRFAGDIIGWGELLRAPAYLLGKLSLYRAFLARRQVDWVRTKRDAE